MTEELTRQVAVLAEENSKLKAERSRLVYQKQLAENATARLLSKHPALQGLVLELASESLPCPREAQQIPFVATQQTTGETTGPPRMLPDRRYGSDTDGSVAKLASFNFLRVPSELAHDPQLNKPPAKDNKTDDYKIPHRALNIFDGRINQVSRMHNIENIVKGITHADTYATKESIPPNGLSGNHYTDLLELDKFLQNFS